MNEYRSMSHCIGYIKGMVNKLVPIMILVFMVVGGWIIVGKSRHNAMLYGIRSELVKPAEGKPFTQDMIKDLPEPVQRYFTHAIKPGTPPASYAELKITGDIRLLPKDRWMPLTADQILSPRRGFIWNTVAGASGLKLEGGDWYYNNVGGMRFWVSGFFPVLNVSNDNIARSARGRLAIESIWVPSSLLPQTGVTWSMVDENSATARFNVDGDEQEITITVDEKGALKTVSMKRWTDQTDDGTWKQIPFGAKVFEEKSFSGYTVPIQITVYWNFGEKDPFDFYRARVVGAEFR